MALTSIYTLDTRLRIKVGGRTPEPVRKRALREAAREFCRRSGAWRETLAAISTVADQADYTVTIPTDGTQYAARILRVSRARLEGAVMNETLWAFSPDHVFSFITAPATADLSLVLDAVFEPTDECYLLPDWMVAKHDQAVVDGAIARILDEAGDPRAADRWAQFNRAIAVEIGQILDGRQSGVMTVRRKGVV